MRKFKKLLQRQSEAKFKTKPERAAAESIAERKSKVIGRHTRSQKKRAPRKKIEFLNWLKKDSAAVFGITILVLSAVIYFGFFTSTFHITSVSVEGTEYIDQADVYKQIDDYRGNNVLGVFSKNLYWFFNSTSLQQQISEFFSESFALESVTVNKKFPKTITVEIRERVPRIAWVNKSANNQESYSLLDHAGFVTQQVPTFADLNASYPRVRDDNRTQVEIGWQLVSAEYLEFLLQVHDNFEAKTNIELDSFILPTLECFEQEYVSEKVFEKELLDSESDEFRDKKRKIQERFQDGEITIDESIDELEQLKNDGLAELGTTEDKAIEKIQWETISVSVECDLVKVANELHVVTTGKNGGFKVFLDTSEDLDLQLENLVSLLEEKNPDRNNIRYIDVRIPDRIFFKKRQ